MLVLYLEIKFYVCYELVVDELYVLYVDESGLLDGLLVVFVYGGFGFGCDVLLCCFFDFNFYCIVIFDQCGCGCFMFYVSLEKNSIWELVVDMECLCEYLGIEKWVLFGGFWGLILLLVYVQIYFEWVYVLILCGIFFCCLQDIYWFYQEGVSCLFFDYWEDYVVLILLEECGDLLVVFYKCLIGSDQIVQMYVVKVWLIWEGCIVMLCFNFMVVDCFIELGRVLLILCIENYFFVNQGFFRFNQLFEDMYCIVYLFGVIVYGCYDVICLLDNVWVLYQVWLNSELQIICDVGYIVSELGIVDVLVCVINEIGW